MGKKKLVVLLAIAVMLSSMFAVQFNVKQVQAQQLGPASDVIYFRQISDDNQAMTAVTLGGDVAGGTDIHFYRVPPPLVTELLQNHPEVGIIFNPQGGYLSLILNPVPMNVTGVFNPLEYREFRYGLQFILERESKIVTEIQKGYATPWLTPVAYYSYDYLNVASTVESLGIRDDLNYGYQLMTDALTKAGAVKGADGIWRYNGVPVSLKVFIRTDDPVRTAIGNDLVAKLRNFGIQVSTLTGDLLAAFAAVYGSDPKDLMWSIYTEGWGATSLVKYQDTAVYQYLASPLGYMPGWATPGFWNYANSTIDKLATDLVTGNFTSEQERNQILNTVIKLGAQESVRIFLAEQYDAYAYNSRRVSPADLVNEYAEGIANRFTLYNIKPINNTSAPIVVGVKYLSQGAANPIGGLTDVYTVMMYYAISDPGIWRDPHSGDVIPWRENFKVVYASPVANYNVPADAIKWDAIHEKWVTVGSGLKAKSVVTYNFTFGNWQDGSPNNIYDILYGLYFLWQWSGNPNSTRYSATYASAVGPFVNQILGVKVSPDGKSLTLYLNYWHFDPNEIAVFLDPWATTPWQLMAAMEQLYVSGFGSWYDSEAQARGNAWLNPLASTHAQAMRNVLLQFNSSNFVPDAFTSGWNVTGLPQISMSEVYTRYTDAVKFINTYNHAFYSNGLFILAQYVSGTLAKFIANRNDPLNPSKWQQFTAEDRAHIDSISYPQLPSYVTQGQTFTANLQISIANIGPATGDQIRSAYFLYDPTGKFIQSGNLTYGGTPGSFSVSFSTAGFIPGLYKITFYVVSKQALWPDVESVQFLVKTPTVTTTTTTSITGSGGTTTSITIPTGTTTSTPTITAPSTPSGVDVYTILIIVLAIIVVAALAVVFLRRPRA
ncbi:MAG TPA: hypothetical protein VKU94_01440 [Geobacterales bacterium]|nr:hypothetical protein [Geobacterales bacterium]